MVQRVLQTALKTTLDMHIPFHSSAKMGPRSACVKSAKTCWTTASGRSLLYRAMCICSEPSAPIKSTSPGASIRVAIIAVPQIMWSAGKYLAIFSKCPIPFIAEKTYWSEWKRPALLSRSNSSASCICFLKIIQTSGGP